MVFTTIFTNDGTPNKAKNHNSITTSFSQVILSDKDLDDFERETKSLRGWRSFFIDNKSTADVEFYFLGDESKIMRCNAGQTRSFNNMRFRDVYWRLRNSNITPEDQEIICLLSTENSNVNVSGTYPKKIIGTVATETIGDGSAGSHTYSAGNDRQMKIIRVLLKCDGTLGTVTHSYVDDTTERVLGTSLTVATQFEEPYFHDGLQSSHIIWRGGEPITVGSGDSIRINFSAIQNLKTVVTWVLFEFVIGD